MIDKGEFFKDYDGLGNIQEGLEANIAVQNDKQFIDKMLYQIELIRVAYNSNVKLYKTSEVLFNLNKDAKDALRNLEDFWSKRIGISIRVLPDTSANAFIFTVVADNFNVINQQAEGIQNSLSTILNGWFKETDLNPNLDKIDLTSDKGYVNILKNLFQGSKEIESALTNGKVEFNLKNATIKGLSDKVVSIMGIDFVEFLNTMSNEEILAIMVHEVGHQYTHLLNMYRKVKTNSILRDATTLMLEGKIDKVVLTMKKEFGIEKPKLDNFKTEDNIKEAILYIEKIVSTGIGNNANYAKHTSRESEAFADQFAANFCLATPLATALDKIVSNNSEVDYYTGQVFIDTMLNNFGFLTALALAMSIILALVALALGNGFGIIVAILLFFVNMMKMVNFLGFGLAVQQVMGFFFGEMDSWEMVYDDKERRLERIRNDSIRILRSLSTNGLDKEMVKLKLAELDIIDGLIEKARKGRNFGGVIGEFLFSNNRKHSKETLVQQLLENLEANKLQVLGKQF